MRVDELPEDVERIWKGTSKKIVHLDEDCHSIGAGGVREWSTHGREHLDVCSFCADRHGLEHHSPPINNAHPNHPLTTGSTDYWSTKNEIDVEAAMLEYAEEP